MLRRTSRPSPALVIATIAVFLLGAGAATGASNLIDGKRIKKNTVPLSALTKGAKRGITGSQGPAGVAGALGAKGDKGDKGDPGTPATRLWGVIEANGQLVRNSGITEVGHGPSIGDQGRYDITFSQPIANCAVIASIGTAGGAATVPWGIIGHRRTSENSVRVETTDGQNTYVNVPFHIAAFC
jgi:hypothetical protein